jgi:chitinase
MPYDMAMRSLPTGFARPLTILSTLTAAAALADGPRVIGYFPEWKSHYSVDDIPADKLTHINYAFALIKDGLCATDDHDLATKHFAKLRELKQKHPHLKTLISVGGWTGSPPFSDAALTDESRDRLARSCADFASQHGFDGVDIDWEFPGGGGVDPSAARPEDTRNFTLLLQQLRKHLDRQGKSDHKRYLLTIAAPAGDKHRANIQLDQIHPLLDFINVMTYDFAGPWSPRTAHNAPLFPAHPSEASVDTTVRAYLAAGVPSDKLVLGVPFYGRAFSGVPGANHGLFQPHTGQPKDHGESTYRSLSRRTPDGIPHRRWDNDAKVPWLYDPQSKVMITYDDPESIRLKSRYARGHKLGGVMFWELSQDDAQSSLLNATHDGFKTP